jgi:hypothetical protein
MRKIKGRANSRDEGIKTMVGERRREGVYERSLKEEV